MNYIFLILVFFIKFSECAFSTFDRPSKIDLFRYLVNQTSTTPPLPKCHCWTSNTRTCVPYDSRLQAASLEEAIVTFPDLTITRHYNSAVKPNSTRLKGPSSCKTNQCRQCYKELRAQLKTVGLLPSTIDDVFNKQDNFTCSEYRFSRKDKGVYSKDKKSSKGHYDWSFEYYSDSSEEDYYDYDSSHKFRGRIWKRDTAKVTSDSESANIDVNMTGIIGVRFPISCTTRGITPDGLNTVSLCSTCWVWRRLPSTYYPAYLNEVVCDISDTTCLSGYASCQTGTQQLNVLRNDSGTLVPVSVSAGINCECRIKVGSALESLVLGNGTSSALPSLTATPKVSNGTTVTNSTGK